jgi:hypothetical protein
MVGMFFGQGMKALPYLCKRNGGDEQVSRVLCCMPCDGTLIRAGLSHFTDEVRVEHEVHSSKRETTSGGICGGSQLVVLRTESYQAMIWRMLGCPLRLLRRDWEGLVRSERALREDNQTRRALAWLSDRPFTFFTAISTLLIGAVCASRLSESILAHCSAIFVHSDLPPQACSRLAASKHAEVTLCVFNAMSGHASFSFPERT